VLFALTAAPSALLSAWLLEAAPAITGRRSARTKRPRRRSASTPSAGRCSRCRDQRGDDRGRRRVLRLLLQQPLPRADLQHQPLDRDHPRPDHRRHRHAVRPDRRRRLLTCSPTASPRRSPRSAGRFRASSRCSTAWCCCGGDVPAPRHLAALARKLKVLNDLLEVKAFRKSFRGLRAVNDASFEVPEGASTPDRPERRRQDHDLQHDRRRLRARRGAIVFEGKAHRRAAARPGLRRRHRPHLPDRQAVRRALGARQRHGGRAAPGTTVASAQATPLRRSSKSSASDAKARSARLLAHPARPQAPRSRARARHPSPKLLLLDEVMAGLRPTECDQMVEVFRELNRARRPDHPADRARHARGDGARAAQSACCITAR
jgi:branched-chain amino acid transport system ATP-binding protein